MLHGLVQIDTPAAAPPPRDFPTEGHLIDSFGRIHTDLRISVTDRCNIRCFYCMPEEGGQFVQRRELLDFDSLLRVVRVARRLGVDKIRLTGGEPLLRPKLAGFVAQLLALGEWRDVALTTNAVLLAQHAGALFDAGLRRLNVHLDTLDRERFRRITRRDELARVLDGIETAQRAGFTRIKLNAVAMKGVTEPDIVPLGRFARERGIELRFIEFMPLDGQQLWRMDHVLTAAEIRTRLEEAFGGLRPVADRDRRAPATEFRYLDGGGTVGFISSVSEPFCLNCNRLRLTADGKLRYCLFAREETNVRDLLADCDDERLEAALRATVWRKWIGHDIHAGTFQAPARPMYSIGG